MKEKYSSLPSFLLGIIKNITRKKEESDVIIKQMILISYFD